MSANVKVETSSAHLISDTGTDVEFRLGYDLNANSGQPLLAVYVYKNGTLVGTPIRFKMAANRVAADLPGVSDQSFITQDGHITNG